MFKYLIKRPLNVFLNLHEGYTCHVGTSSLLGYYYVHRIVSMLKNILIVGMKIIVILWTTYELKICINILKVFWAYMKVYQ